MATKKTIFDYYDMGSQRTQASANNALALSEKLFENSVDHYHMEQRKVVDRVIRDNPNLSVQNFNENNQDQPDILALDLVLNTYKIYLAFFLKMLCRLIYSD